MNTRLLSYRFFILLSMIIFVLSACSTTQSGTSQANQTAIVHRSTTTPALVTPTASHGYTPFQPPLAKVVKNGPVYVTGDSSVPDEALTIANTLLQAMLKHRPDIVTALRSAGTMTVVSSRNENICALPYFKQSTSLECQSYATGYVGGTHDFPITVCSEKNLLAEPDDAYQRGKSAYSQNMCVQALAFTIMNVGLSSADRTRIYERFVDAKQEGKWGATDYAMLDQQTFWTVMSQFYFSAGPAKPYSPTFTHVANSPEALKQYDPTTFALLDSIYQGSTDLH